MRLLPLFLVTLLVATFSLSAETITLIALAPTHDSSLMVEQLEKQPETLTLPQAVIAATTDHPTIKSTKLNAEIARLAEKSAWAGYLPKVGITSAMVGSKTTKTGIITTTLNAAQSLIDLAGPQVRAEQTAIDSKIARTQVSAAQQQKRAAVEELFLNTWLKQEEYKVLRRELEFVEKTQNTNKEKYETGLLSLPEYQKTIADSTAAATKCAIHKNQFVSLLAELEEITGIFLTDGAETNVILEWSPNLEFELDAVDTYLSHALKNRLELEVCKLNYKRTRVDEKFARGKTFPSLSAIGQCSYDYQPGNPDYRDFSYAKTNYFGGLQLSWNVFDGTLSKIEAENARIRALKSSTDKEITQKKIEKEVKQLYNGLKITQQQAKSSQSQLSAATSALQSAQEAQTVGSITATALLGSSTQQLKSQFDYLSQLVTFQRQFFALNAACGYALDNA
jgi:outer membrane protein TolC